MQEQYVLVADRTDTVLATGTEAECEFAMKAMLKYGIADDRMFVCPKDYFEKSLTEESN